MQLFDTAVLDGVKVTADGYLAVNAKVARTGIQIYTGDQVGRPELPTVRVYRPESEVFADAAMKSYAHRPVTDDHPAQPVTADNWKDLSVGTTGDEVLRDGQSVRVSMLLMDAAAIKTVNDGKRELSMGYTADIVWRDGTTDAGEKYDAIQTNLRMNHLAIVAKARGGSTLKIGDKQPKGGRAMPDLTTMVLDGISFEVPSTAQANIKTLFDAKDKALSAALADADKAKTKLTAAEEAAEKLKGEKAMLEKQVKDAAMTPEKLTDAVKARTALIGDAKAVLGDDAKLDALTDAAIKRSVVSKVLGDDAAKDLTDAAVDGAYAVAIKSAGSADPVRGVMQDGLKVDVNDAADARAKMMNDKQNAWKGAA